MKHNHGPCSNENHSNKVLLIIPEEKVLEGSENIYFMHVSSIVTGKVVVLFEKELI